MLVVGDEEIQLEIDYDVLDAEIETTLSDAYDELYEEYVAENPEPSEDASDEEWNEFYDGFNALWEPVYDSIYYPAYNAAVIAAAAAQEIELETEATGHVIEKVDGVAATYEKDGVKAHYACECGKLYSDAEGKNEVTAEELVIEKLVKEEDKTQDKQDDKTADTDKQEKPEGDTSDKAPQTGESALVVFIALLIGCAALVLTKKARNR